MNSIIAVDILPDNDGKVAMYGAPNRDATYSVTGKLRIVLSKPMKTKHVSLKLKGKSEYTDWEQQYSSISVLKLEKVLCEKTTLTRGVNDLTFEFLVPGHMPQTYVTSFGLVRYNLDAHLQPASLLAKDGRAECSLSFCRYYLPCRRDLLPAPPTKVYRGKRKNLLKYELDVPTMVGVNEKSMIVRIRLQPLCVEGKLKKISFDLAQTEKYRVQPSQRDMSEYTDGGQLGNVQLNGTSGVKRKRTHPIMPTSLSISDSEDAWERPLTYNLPFAQFSSASSSARKARLKSTVKSPLMQVRHKFKIVMSFVAVNEKDFKLSFPMIVTTIPDQSGNPGEHYPSATESFDSGLPTYDDVLRSMEAVSPQEEVTDADQVDGFNSNLNSCSPSQATSRNNSRPVTPPIAEDEPTEFFAESSGATLSSSSPDEATHSLHNRNERLYTEQRTGSVSDPSLRQNKNQRNLAHTLGRFLGRSRSSSPTPESTISSPEAGIPPQMEVIPSTPAFQLPPPAYAPTEPSLSVAASVASFGRPGRNSWYLDENEDELPRTIPEICSAPSSPRMQACTPLPMNSNRLQPPPRRSHFRSASFDGDGTLATTTRRQ